MLPPEKPASTHPGTAALAKPRAAKKAAQAAESSVEALESAPIVEFSEAEPAVEVPEPVPTAEVSEPAPPVEAPESAPEAETQEAAPKFEADLLGLLRYLIDLSEALPEPVLDDFMHSDTHREIKYIINTLENPNG
jgi:hypothetical protein